MLFNLCFLSIKFVKQVIQRLLYTIPLTPSVIKLFCSMKAFVVNPDIFISVIVQRPDSVNSLFTVRGVVRSTPFDGPIELFLVPANAPQVV